MKHFSTAWTIVGLFAIVLGQGACGSSGSSSPTAPSSTPAVSQSPLASIAVNLETATVNVGGSIVLTVTGTHSDGTTSGVNAIWGSTDPSIASVSATGTVTGVAVGIVTITATFGGQSATVLVSVLPTDTSGTTTSTFTLFGRVTGALAEPLADVTISILDGEHAGRTTTSDTNGHFSIADLTGRFNVSATKSGYGEQRFGASQASAVHDVTLYALFVLTGDVVSQVNTPLSDVTITILDGNLSGWTTQTTTSGRYEMPDVWGSFTVEATKSGYESQQQVATRTAAVLNFTLSSPLSTLSITFAKPTLYVGTTTTASAEAIYEDDSRQQITPTWGSNAPTIASVSSDGVITAIGIGSAEITASFEGKSTTATIEVIETPPVTSVEVSITDDSLRVGDDATVTATAGYANGDTQVVTPAWDTSDASIASVTSAGTVTGVGAGTATITGTYENVVGSVTVNVSELTTIDVAIEEAALRAGESTTVTAQAHYSDGAIETISPTWSSGNTSVASVSSSGTVTGVAAGSVTITASYQTKTGSVTLVVSDLSSIAVSVDSASFWIGQTATVTAQGTYSDGTTEAVTPEWTSSDANVAPVNSSGTVTGLAAGSAVITGTSRGKSGTVTVEVRTPALLSVEASVGDSTLRIGDTTTITLTGSYEGDTTKSVAATWQSSDASVASVNSSGTITGVAIGSAQITGTYDGKSAAVTIDVSGLSSVSVSVGDSSLRVGDTTSATATANYSDGETEQVTASWASSDANIASVNSSGTITAVAQGSVTITGTYNEKSGSATVDVAALSSVSVSVGDSSLRVGDTTSATATATYSDGATETVTASWASSDANIASVSSSGTITAVAQGSATITGTYNDKSGSATVNVAGLSSVSVAVGDSSLNVGDTTSATATATYSDGATETVTASWSSSDANIASVNSSGTVTGVAEGSADITGTFNGQSGSVTVEVTEENWVIMGGIGDAIAGTGVEGATVTISKGGGAATASTDADGVWGVNCLNSGNFCAGVHDITVEKSGFVTSKSQINVTSDLTVGLRNIFANQEPFDLNFVDHVYRQKGTEGIHKWESTPTVEIWTTRFVCSSIVDVWACDSMTSLGVSTAASHESMARVAVNAVFPNLTGSALSAPSIQTKTHAFGTEIDLTGCTEANKVIFAYVSMGVITSENNRSYEQQCHYSNGAIGTSLVVIKPNKSVGTFLHETGHVIGMDHPDGYDAIPRPSLMQDSSGNASIWDIAAGLYNYYRPLGNTSPDTDPGGNYINLFGSGLFTGVSPSSQGVGGSMSQDGGSPYSRMSPDELDRLVASGVFPIQPLIDPTLQTSPPTGSGALIFRGRVP